MNLLILSIVFFVGLAVGFFIGRKRAYKKEVLPELERKINEQLKVLRKSEPKTHAEKQVEALDKGKPIVKTFYK